MNTIKKRCGGNSEVLIVIVIITVVVGALLGGWAIYKNVQVWSAEKTGQAELAQAAQNRQIAVNEATAKAEAAIMLAKAEVERARGVAEANRIIGESLKGNDSYLRYLWIMSLENGQQPTIVYVPTEANLPIMEAMRLKVEAK